MKNMEAKIYGLDSPQYRILEKENNAGEKFYFLQRALYGFHYYERKFPFFKKKHIKSELEWVYLYEQKDKGQFSNDYFDCIMTKDIYGEDLPPIDLNKHLDKACKSHEEATQLMHEHIGWIKFLQKKSKEHKEEEEKSKLKETQLIIPLYETSGKIKATVYDNTVK